MIYTHSLTFKKDNFLSLAKLQYSAGVTCLKWLPLDLDPTGVQILIGYADGVLRLFALESDTDTGAGGKTVYRLTKALAAK